MRRLTILLVVPLIIAACSDDNAASPSPATAALPATVCVTSQPPDGRLVHLTLDDTVDGFGSLGSRANDGLTPGVIRVELEADAENADPAVVRITLDGAPAATIAGVAAGTTCGIDLDATVGTYHVLDDFGHDVEFDVVAGE